MTILQVGGPVVRKTVQATTSGTEFEFTGIPASARMIWLVFNGVSIDAGQSFLVQIGDAGGYEATDYISTSLALETTPAISAANNTTGYIIRNGSTSAIFSGCLQLKNVTGNLWVADGVFKRNTTIMVIAAGDKTLSATLDRVKLLLDGAGNFDAGSINLLYA